MKLQKSFLAVALAAISAIFISCDGGFGASKPKIDKVTAFNHAGEEIQFSMGDINVDPNELAYIDIHFDTAMDTSYNGWIYYGDSIQYIYNSGWRNSYTYRMGFSLMYSTDFKVVINDSKYGTDHPEDTTYTPKNAYWRDINGNTIGEYHIEFSTKPSPNHPLNLDYDISTETYQDMFVELQYNEYGNPPNMQTGIAIAGLFMPEKLKAGDTLKLKYKIRSDYDLPKIIVNLVDVSEAASYWTILAKEEDIPLTTEAIKASTEEDPLYYENEILFHITKDMTSSCTIQFTCKECDPESEDPIQFYLVTEKAE